MCNPHFMSKNLRLSTIRIEYLHKLFEILCMGDLPLFPIYSTIDLYHYLLVDIYFIPWLQSNIILFIKLYWVLFHVAPVSLCHTTTIMGVFTFCALSYFLAQQDSPGSTCIFPTLFSRSAFLQRALVLFIGKWY